MIGPIANLAALFGIRQAYRPPYACGDGQYFQMRYINPDRSRKVVTDKKVLRNRKHRAMRKAQRQMLRRR